MESSENDTLLELSEEQICNAIHFMISALKNKLPDTSLEKEDEIRRAIYEMLKKYPKEKQEILEKLSSGCQKNGTSISLVKKVSDYYFNGSPRVADFITIATGLAMGWNTFYNTGVEQNTGENSIDPSPESHAKEFDYSKTLSEYLSENNKLNKTPQFQPFPNHILFEKYMQKIGKTDIDSLSIHSLESANLELFNIFKDNDYQTFSMQEFSDISLLDQCHVKNVKDPQESIELAKMAATLCNFHLAGNLALIYSKHLLPERLSRTPKKESKEL